MKREIQWFIINVPSGIINGTNAFRRKDCIADFLKWYSEGWKQAKKNGYKCIKITVEYPLH